MDAELSGRIIETHGASGAVDGYCPQRRDTGLTVKGIAATAVRRLRRLAALTLMPIHCRRYCLQRIGPSYFIRKTIDASSVVIDCGLGNDADFSDEIITRYDSQCHGVDPTRKHQEALAAVVSRHTNRLHLYPIALAGTTGSVTFREAVDQISGSVFDSHVNAGHAISYTVPSKTLEDLIEHIGVARIDILKLDIEGSEYEVLASIGDDRLRSIGQLIVEFHHHCVGAFTSDDTKRAIGRLTALGFRSYSADGINFLFFRL